MTFFVNRHIGKKNETALPWPRRSMSTQAWTEQLEARRLDRRQSRKARMGGELPVVPDHIRYNYDPAGELAEAWQCMDRHMEEVYQQKEASRAAAEALECAHASTHVDWITAEETCTECGFVLRHVYRDDDAAQTLQQSFYSRKHHWNDRLNQLFCRGRRLDPQVMSLVERHFAEQRAASGKAVVPSKARILLALRQLRKKPEHRGNPRLQKELKKSTERWIEIRCKLERERPPQASGDLYAYLLHVLTAVEVAFEVCKPPSRHSLLHYNYVFVRVLQHYSVEHNCPEAARLVRFFPPLKSKSKVRDLDAIWQPMCAYLHWEYLPFPQPKAFRGYK